MLVSRAISQATRCSSCRYHVLNAFLGAADQIMEPLHQSSLPQKRVKPSGNRRGSCASRRWLSDKPALSETSTQIEDAIVKETSRVVDHPNPPAQLGKPWYLQVDTFPEIEAPARARLELPELPPNPPQILKPTLDFLLYQLGLDNLKLLDLRGLDPPPALGADLLMIVGTARSEKHLHVSGDRLRKWMKTEHGRVARADGLVGRGELKLRLKRKARRARILSRVGSVDTPRADDGLRSGWVCVTVGDNDYADDSQFKDASSDIPDGFVGFGVEAAGPKMAIQMLTVEKREELDLEGLWGDILWRHGRKQAKIAAIEEMASTPNSQEPGQTPPGAAEHRGKDAKPATAFNKVHLESFSGSKFAWSQARGFSHSTSFRRPKRHEGRPPIPKYYFRDEYVKSEESSNQTLRSSQNEESPPPTVVMPQDSSAEMPKPGNQHAEQSAFDGPTDIESIVGQRAPDEHSAIENLRQLEARIDFLRSLPQTEVQALLDHNPSDTGMTPFLLEFMGYIPLIPAAEHWVCLVELHCIGVVNQCRDFDKTKLVQVFHEMRSALISVPAAAYRSVIETLLTPSAVIEGPYAAAQEPSFLGEAAEIVQDMGFRGHDWTAKEIQQLFEARLIEVIARDPSNVTSPVARVKLHLRIWGIFSEPSSGELTSLTWDLKRIHVSAYHGHWQGVWDVWHEYPAKMQPRPKELYLVLLQTLAGRDHTAEMLTGLRKVVRELDQPEPEVDLDGDIAEAILACLRAIEPTVDDSASSDWHSKDEIYRLWHRCEIIRQDARPFLREYDDD